MRQLPSEKVNIMNRKKISIFAAITIGLVLLAVVSGCVGDSNNANANQEGSGGIISSAANSGTKGSADIQDIIDNTGKYMGKTVTVVGKPHDSVNMKTVYSVSAPDNIRRDGYLAVETNNYPKERLLCVAEISVTGVVRTSQGPGGQIPFIKETSRQIISIDRSLC